jgi:hypothetical protein
MPYWNRCIAFQERTGKAQVPRSASHCYSVRDSEAKAGWSCMPQSAREAEFKTGHLPLVKDWVKRNSALLDV